MKHKPYLSITTYMNNQTYLTHAYHNNQYLYNLGNDKWVVVLKLENECHFQYFDNHKSASDLYLFLVTD